MAELKIYNDIMDEETKLFLQWMGSDAVCFKDVDTFIASIPTDDAEILMKINCRGGMTSEGLAMYDALRASGKNISAEVIGECSSMATVILLAAAKGQRRAHPNAKLLVHEPYLQGICHACGAEDLQRASEDLQRETERFLDIYTERTGTEREALRSLMKENRMMEIPEAISMGFIDSVIEPISATRDNDNIINQKTMSKSKIKDAFSALGRALGINDSNGAVAMELQTADGATLTIERDNGEPQVGDKATPDGEFVMPDGSTITVKDGVISEIKPAEEEKPTEETTPNTDETELSKANARIAELEAKLKESDEEKQKCAKTQQELQILNAVAMAGGMEWLKKARSEYKVQGRETEAKVDRTETAPRMSIRDYLETKKQK